MRKLSEEELLDKLSKAFSCYLACARRTDKRNIDETSSVRKLAHLQIKELIQKPSVTEEWIIEKACEASRFYSVSCETVRDSEGFIRSLIKELSTTVESGNE